MNEGWREALDRLEERRERIRLLRAELAAARAAGLAARHRERLRREAKKKEVVESDGRASGS